MPRKIANASPNDGTAVVSMPRMGWFVVTPPTSWGTRTVVSDMGDILSPMYPPEMTAPAAIAPDIFRSGAMPTNATPSVPAVVQELPVTTPTMAQRQRRLRRR